MAVARHPLARAAPTAPSSAAAPLARARPQRSWSTLPNSVDCSVQPAPRPFRSTSETKCSQRPPSHDDTDVVGWRRVSRWSHAAAVAAAPTRGAIRSAPTNHRRRLPGDRPLPHTAPHKLLAQVEHPAGRSRMLVAVHGLAVRSASDAIRAPLTEVVETGLLSRATPWLAPRRRHHHRRPPPPRARETTAIMVNSDSQRGFRSGLLAPSTR